MTLLIVLPNRDEDALALAENLRNIAGDIEVNVWPDTGDPDRVEMIVTWRHPHGLLADFPNLRLLASYGAGVEHLLDDPNLPDGVPIVRTVEPALVRGIAEYVVLAIGNWRRGWGMYEDDQRRQLWRPRAYPVSSTVLLMGGGRMGSSVARVLMTLGFQVVVWSRGSTVIDGVEAVFGRAALERFVPLADAVVCLLPLTFETKGILNRDFFAMMKPGSLLVNVGRGDHLVENDLIDGLAEGRPGHAVLDVFCEEPLPPEHVFWRHQDITATPHIAALTDPHGAAQCVAENWRRLQSGEPLMDLIDRRRGY